MYSSPAISFMYLWISFCSSFIADLPCDKSQRHVQVHVPLLTDAPLLGAEGHSVELQLPRAEEVGG